MIRRVLCVVGAAAVVCLLLASCSHKTPQQAKRKQFVVGVTLLTEEHPFYRELKSAFLEECKKRNLKPIVLSCNMDLATQTAQIENFITKGVDAMVVCPAESAGIVGAIRKANASGIPVFTADIAAQGGKVVSHIASDNVQGGRLAGEYMAKLLKGKGNVAIINHPVVKSVQDRVKGFREAIAKYPGIKIVDDQAAEGQRDKAVTVAENLLQKHKKLDGIFAINDSTALGALAAIEQSGRKDIVLIGYDGDPEAREKIRAGTALKADAVQYPREIGRITADTVADYLSGKKVKPYIPVKVGIVDRAALLGGKS
ncbi:MAG: substrate-binding domain-containing protein [Armatimonadota bacterium]|nr:substrate-binding domain-containing protein [Armatimonadota bacterium]